MSANNVHPNSEEQVAQVVVKQGDDVLKWGVVGILLACIPAAVLLPGIPSLGPYLAIIGPILWACLVGWPVTFFWSKSLHARIAILREKLLAVNGLQDDEKKSYPGRVPWMPAWVGIFERAFYTVLIGLNVEGGAAFIGVWVGLKLAGGWQLWSTGTTYGRAIFFSGLLGNAMSVTFGIVAGLTTRALTHL